MQDHPLPSDAFHILRTVRETFLGCMEDIPTKAAWRLLCRQTRDDVQERARKLTLQPPRDIKRLYGSLRSILCDARPMEHPERMLQRCPNVIHLDCPHLCRGLHVLGGSSN